MQVLKKIDVCIISALATKKFLVSRVKQSLDKLVGCFEAQQ